MQKGTRKLSRLAIRALSFGLVLLAVFYVFRSSARAEGEDTSAGESDLTATVPLTAPDGEAAVNEYTENGGTGNQVGDLDDEDKLTFENDLPSVTTTTIETLDTTGTVTDTNVTNTLTLTANQSIWKSLRP